MQNSSSNKLKYIVAIAVIGVILFYFGFYQEYSHYNKSISSKDLNQINSYMVDYPNGKYVKEVAEHFELTAFQKVLSDSSATDIENYFSSCPEGKHLEDVRAVEFLKSNKVVNVRNFIEMYPKSKYMAQAKARLLQLWENEISFFDYNVKNLQLNPNTKSVKFFRGLLNYMKDNNKGTFYVKFKHKFDLKDLTDYPKSVQKLLTAFGGDNENGFFTPAPSSENTDPIKGNFSAGNIHDLETRVAEKLKANIDSVFGENFFEFVTISADDSVKYSESDVVIDINYKINNNEYLGIPNLLVHYERSSENVSLPVFKSYVMGIKTDFNLKIRNPNDNTEYVINDRGDAQDEYKNISSVSDGYIQMVRDTFEDFIVKVSNQLGLRKDDE